MLSLRFGANLWQSFVHSMHKIQVEGNLQKLLHCMCGYTEPEFVNVYGAQESILRNRFRQPMYIAWRAGALNRVVVPARHAGNRFLGSFKGLQIRALLCSLQSTSLQLEIILSRQLKHMTENV
jgi:hypothetical protein